MTIFSSIDAIDPTHTLSLRKMFSDQFKARFVYLKRASNKSIIENDCFGITLKKDFLGVKLEARDDNWKGRVSPVGNKSFEYLKNPFKIEAFMSWLDTMEENAIFQVTGREILSNSTEPVWANSYLRDGFKKGVLRARQEIRNDQEILRVLGKTKADFPVESQDLEEAISLEYNEKVLALLLIEMYNDMKGVVNEVNKLISRSLAEDLRKSADPRSIARRISNHIDSIGIRRGTILARTMIIKAHHLANVQEYKAAGLKKVKVLAEWKTAGDSRVCELCSPLDGQIFTLDDVEDMIPVHPQCRCVILPLQPDFDIK